MKLDEKTSALGIGVLATMLFTTLLVFAKITPLIFSGMVIATMVLCVAIAALPRLREFNLREMKLLLAEAEKVKAELREIYGNIEHLKFEPMKMSDEMYEGLGMHSNGAIVLDRSIMNYTIGCIKRERERLARVFIADKSGDKLAEAILDPSLDLKVFKWVGPRARLDDPAPQP